MIEQYVIKALISSLFELVSSNRNTLRSETAKKVIKKQLEKVSSSEKNAPEKSEMEKVLSYFVDLEGKKL